MPVVISGAEYGARCTAPSSALALGWLGCGYESIIHRSCLVT